MEQKMGWKRALEVTFPVAMGYAPAGMAFGVLASVAGISWWVSILISIIVFSGAAQYAVIPMIAGGAGIFNISVNTFVINLRHVFYALPLLDILPKNRLKRAYCLFALTDECFSVMTTLSKEEQKALYPKIALLVHSYWVGATIVGIIAGQKMAELVPNLDFALASLFVILWFEQVRAKKVWWPSIFAFVLFIFMLWLFPDFALLGALILSVIAILLRGIIKPGDVS